MTDTPTPLVTPDEAILTTLGDARRIGHGRVAFSADGYLHPVGSWLDGDARPVFWWPDPPRTVTIEIPADVRDYWADESAGDYEEVEPTAAIVDACRASRDAEA